MVSDLHESKSPSNQFFIFPKCVNQKYSKYYAEANILAYFGQSKISSELCLCMCIQSCNNEFMHASSSLSCFGSYFGSLGSDWGERNIYIIQVHSEHHYFLSVFAHSYASMCVFNNCKLLHAPVHILTLLDWIGIELVTKSGYLNDTTMIYSHLKKPLMLASTHDNKDIYKIEGTYASLKRMYYPCFSICEWYWMWFWSYPESWRVHTGQECQQMWGYNSFHPLPAV